jgi:hypothetical protein
MRTPAAHYIAYLRPRTFAPTFLLAATGYAASPRRPASTIACVTDLAILFATYSVLLWGGANAFNSAEDQDRGPVNLLPDPPPTPPGLAPFGIAVQVFAIGVAALRGWRPAAIVAASVVASVFYSWRGAPWRRGKEIGVVDNLINATGTGFAAITLGYAITPAPIDARIVLIALAFTVATFGGVPTSQIFQLTPADTYETARNYASLLGARATLRVGALLFVAHVALLAAVGWPPRGLALAAWVGWAVLALAASGHSLEWSRNPFQKPYERMTRQFGMMMMSQTLWGLAAWLTTSPGA